MNRPFAFSSALALFAVLPTPGPAAASEATVAPAGEQIAAAVLAAPQELRESATVLGRRDGVDGLVELRAGDGPLVCLADDPSDDRFHVACYHRDLEPFMARGRELKAGGAGREEVVATRGAEIEAGSLPFPDGPRALYSLTGPADAFDPATGEAPGAMPVGVVYIPGATAESTGLSTAPPFPGAPWIMSGGDPWAHVMVVPPKPAEEPKAAEEPSAGGADGDAAAAGAAGAGEAEADGADAGAAEPEAGERGTGAAAPGSGEAG